MLEFLGTENVGPKFRTLKKGVPSVSIAVAFWGKGALKELGLTRPQKARIICNLDSTACNPYVIEQLKKKKGISVRSNSRLHAKVYAGADFAIVGSSNASTNGLGDEGDISDSWIEANVASDDPKLVGATLASFDKLWNDKKNTLTITRTALRIAKKAYDNRPRRSGSTKATTLLAACRENPESFNSVFVAAYDAGLGSEGKSGLSRVRSGAVAIADSPRAEDFKHAWGYQFGQKLPKGAWIVDIDCKNNNCKIYGCSEVTGLYFSAGDEYDLMITLKGVVPSPIGGRRLPISAEEKRELIRVAPALLKQDKFVPLPTVMKMIDRKGSASKR